MSLLESAVALLREEIAPRAAEIDRDPAALGAALDLLGRHDLLALRCPAAFGGPACTDEEVATFQEEVARASGALAFLQTQHQGVVGMLAACPNEALQRDYLPHMASGARRLGVGFGHLRRPGPPVVTAERVDGGYRFAGEVPWVTGQGFFPELVGAANLPDGSAVFGLLPLEDGEEGVTLGPPAELAVMEVTRTVTVGLSGFLVPDERVVMTCPPGWIEEVDALTLRRRCHLNMGCALAGLDALERVADRSPAARETFTALQDEVARCRAVVRGDASDLSDLEIRAWAIELAVRVGHAAVTATSGASVLSSHPAQRVYREALAYTVLGQSAAVRDATLARLVHGGDGGR